MHSRLPFARLVRRRAADGAWPTRRLSCFASILPSGRIWNGSPRAICAASTHRSSTCCATRFRVAASSPGRARAGADESWRRRGLKRWQRSCAANRRSAAARCVPATRDDEAFLFELHRAALERICRGDVGLGRRLAARTLRGALRAVAQRAHRARSARRTGDRPHQPDPPLAKDIPARHRADRQRAQSRPRHRGRRVACWRLRASRIGRSNCWFSTAIRRGASTRGWDSSSSPTMARDCACARSEHARRLGTLAAQHALQPRRHGVDLLHAYRMLHAIGVPFDVVAGLDQRLPGRRCPSRSARPGRPCHVP